MNGKTYINGDELTSLANSLKSKSENILSTYKGDCSQAIEMSTECLQLSGLNTTEFFQALEKIYTQVNERINSFADFLTNVVVAEYSAVAEAISNSFNVGFAQEISSILGLSPINTVQPVTPIGPITKPALPGNPIPAKPSPTPGESIPKKPAEPVIELDPREKDGFNKPVITEDVTPKEPIAPTKPIKGDDEIKAVAFGEGETSAPAAAEKPTVKPDLPPLPEATTKPEVSSTSPKPVYFDEGSAPTIAPIKPNSQVQATIAAPAPAAPVVTPPKPTVKPDLPTLPSTPASTSKGSVSYGSTISGGGGGGMGAAAIALDSGLTNPLKLRF